MQLFYTPDLNGSIYTLNEEESKHCTRVLRLVVSDIVYLTDGKGLLAKARIVDDHPKRVTVELIERHEQYGKRSYYLHIAIAPTKNIERIEWFLEKATEQGIDEVSFIVCNRSERKEVKIERLQKVVTAAVKQSLKAYHPLINEAVLYKDFINQEHQLFQHKYIAHCIDNIERKNLWNDYKQGNCLVLIGPEGDFDESEVKLALNKGFKSVSLGQSRLRTETAALTVSSLAYITNN